MDEQGTVLEGREVGGVGRSERMRRRGAQGMRRLSMRGVHVKRGVVARGTLIGAAAALSLALMGGAQPAFAAGTFKLQGSFGAAGTKLGQLEEPAALAVEASTGDVFVADVKNERVQKFEPRGAGSYEAVTELHAATGTFKLKNFSGLAVDDSDGASAGDVYLANGKDVEQFVPVQGHTNDYAAARLLFAAGEDVHGLAVDANGDVYVADGQSLSVFSPDGSELTPSPQQVGATVAGVAVLGRDVYLATTSGLERWTLSTAGELNSEGEPLGEDELIGKVTIAEAEAPSVFEAVTVGWKDQVYVDVKEGKAGHVAAYAPEAEGESAPVEEFGGGQIGASFGIAALAGNVPTMLVSDASADQVDVYPHVAPPEISSCTATPDTSGARVACAIAPEAIQASWQLAYRFGFEAFKEVLSGAVTAPGEVEGELTGLEPAQNYEFRLAAANTNGEVHLEQMFKTKPVAPPVAVSAASDVLARAATLNATVNPENSATFYRFQYGPCEATAGCATSPYPDESAQASAGSRLGAVTVAEPVGELQPQTSYHYRVVALDVAGENVSGEGTFTTTALSQAQALTGAASDVSQTAATIAGTVAPNGQATSFVWEVGTSASYGTSVYGSAGEGEAESLSLQLSSLLPATTYHYRLVASNRSGTVYGADQTFTTLADTSLAALVAPASPPLVPFVSESVTPSGEVLAFKAKPTNAQLLAKALKACRKEAARKRAVCERTARKRYPTKPAAKQTKPR
jgi:hypothetical protein